MDQARGRGRPPVSDSDRKKIERLLKMEMPAVKIAAKTGFHVVTIYTIKRIMEAREQA